MAQNDGPRVAYGVTIRHVIESGVPHHAVDRAQLEAAISRDVRALSAESDRITRVFANRHRLSNNDLDALLHIIVADSAGTPLTSGELSERLGFTAAMEHLSDAELSAAHTVFTALATSMHSFHSDLECPTSR
jgi:hypothetical protein